MSDQVIAREPCPKCGSRDNLARYADGHAYCFSPGCGHFERGDGVARKKMKEDSGPFTPLSGSVEGGIPSRKLTEETCAKWGYKKGVASDGENCQIANFYDDSGMIIAQKLRFPGKRFTIRGDATKMGLYGQQLWRDGGKRIIITEGELDALSVSQVLGNRWPVVSLPNGASSVKKAISSSLKYLLQFDEIVLCFDNDEAGQVAVREAVVLFPPGRVKIASLSAKDANEMLCEGRADELVRALWDARSYRPDGIVTIDDVWERASKPPEIGLPWFLPSLNLTTYGRRYGEAVGLGAGTGVGKTTLITQQIAYDLELGHPVGVFALEQHPSETVKRVAGMLIQEPLHIPSETWDQKKLTNALKLLKKGPGLYLYDSFGASDWDRIRETIRYLYHTHGVRLFYLDHLTALAAAEEDERKALEQIMAEIGSLVKELDIWLLFVSHLTTPEGKPHEEGGRVMIRHFKGSRAIGFWSHFMFGLERAQQSDDFDERMQTCLRVLKDRYTGLATGQTIMLSYDAKTGMLSEMDGQESMFKPTTEEADF